MRTGLLVQEVRYNLNITVPSAVTRSTVAPYCKRLHETPRTFLFGRTLGRKSDGTDSFLFSFDVKSDAGTPVQEVCNPLEVFRGTTARGHRNAPDADPTGREYRGVDRDCVAIKRDGRSLTHFLYVGLRQSVWTKIPEHQVIVSSATGELVPLGNQGFYHGACIGRNGLGVFHKFRCVHLQQLRSQGSDLDANVPLRSEELSSKTSSSMSCERDVFPFSTKTRSVSSGFPDRSQIGLGLDWVGLENSTRGASPKDC